MSVGFLWNISGNSWSRWWCMKLTSNMQATFNPWLENLHIWWAHIKIETANLFWYWSFPSVIRLSLVEFENCLKFQKHLRNKIFQPPQQYQFFYCCNMGWEIKCNSYYKERFACYSASKLAVVKLQIIQN